MSEFILRVRDRFEAAHALTSYRGAAEPVHGHSWRVEAVVTASELDEDGLAFDFVEVKGALAELVARFHHRNLNEVPPFDRESPTTEHLARWFHRKLAPCIPAPAPRNLKLKEVTVWEGPNCSATYRV